jgi:hypothetical protein
MKAIVLDNAVRIRILPSLITDRRIFISFHTDYLLDYNFVEITSLLFQINFALKTNLALKICSRNIVLCSGLGGLVFSMLPSGTQVRGFEPGRSRRIFRAKKSSECLPSEGK